MKAHIIVFVERCFKHEKLMHRWIQIELAEKLKLEEEKEEIELADGCHCVDTESQVKMVEFHVDDHHAFQDKMNSTTRFGGNPRQNELDDQLSWGQSECPKA
jgi:hypothetical protein